MSITLDEAIRHAMNIAKKQEELAEVCVVEQARDSCLKCAEEHRQLAEWLNELAERRKLPEIIRCKDCKHYHTDVCGSELGIGGIYENIIVAHNACDRWAKGMNCVEPEGFCFLAERRTDGD